MIGLRTYVIAFAIAVAGFANPGHAEGNHLDVELRFFESMCVATAPKLAAADMRAAAKEIVATKIKLGPGSNFDAKNGLYCNAKFRWKDEKLSAVPEARVKSLVQTLADRIGASDISREAGQGGNALKYTVKTEKYQFTLIFEVAGSERSYSISKHR